MHLNHITLQTGHTRKSDRSELSTQVLAYCTDLITQCLLNPDKKIAIDNLDGYFFSAGNIGANSLFGTVWHGQKQPVPLVTLIIAKKSRNATKLWQELHRHCVAPAVTDINNAPQVPWCAVSLTPMAGDYADALGWLGDFERCLAWAWVDYETR